MLTAVLIVLLLTGRADPYTFTGGTENGSFTCHCEPDVQCDDDTGECWQCGAFWLNDYGCQYGHVALWRGTADQTGDGNHEADICIDDDTNRDITQGSCCNPRRADGELSWTVDLGGIFVIDIVRIYYTADDVYMDTVRGVEVYASASRTLTDTELCEVERSGSAPNIGSITDVECYFKVGRYVTIRQPNVTIEEMMFCQVQVNGYEYYPCGFYDGDYRWGIACLDNCHCEHQCDVMTGVCDGDCTAGWKKDSYDICEEPCDPGFGDGKCYPCRCLDVSEDCDVKTGHCESGCNDRYIGEVCNVVKPSLRDSTLTITEDKDVITATITDIEYRTELVSDYLVQYKLLHEDTFISINVNPISGRRRREVGADDVVLQIPISNQSINSQYEFRITPLISSPEYNGVVGVSSNITLYNSGCLQYTGLPSCNHWCVCRDDPGTLCLLTCDYCDVCDSEPELPSERNVNFDLFIFTNSLRIQFVDAHPDLPFILVFLSRLDDHHANISSLASNIDYTYNSLNPNTAYDIDITAVLVDGVLSKSWTLTATTLTESSDNNDNILPVVVGCVVSVAVVLALSVVIGILLKRRKARQSQKESPQEQQPEESYDYIDESNMRTSTQLSDNMYLTPVVTPGDATQEQQSEEPYDYIDESSMRKSTQTPDTVYLTPVVTPGDATQEQQSEKPNDCTNESSMRKSTQPSDNMYLTPVVAHGDATQEQQSEEPNDCTNESSMRKSTQPSDNMYLTPVVAHGDRYEQLETNTREPTKLYENENGGYASVEKDAE